MTIRLCPPCDLDEYCRLWNEIWPSLAIDEEQLRRDDETLSAELRESRWLAVADGKPVGFAVVYRPAGAFHRGKWMLYVGVSARYRNQGIGSALFDAVRAHITDVEFVHMLTQVREDDALSLAFALKRGFSEVTRDFESQLDLNAVSLSGLADLMTLPKGIRLVPFTELDSQDFRHKFHALFEIVRQDIPRPEPPVPLTFEFFNKQVLSDPTFLTEGTFVALLGEEPIGFCGIYRGANEGWVDQWLTAVHPDHRGCGIAFALKIAVIQWAKAAGYTTIRTDNSSLNAPMLAINDRLGFTRSAAILTVRTESKLSSEASQT